MNYTVLDTKLKTLIKLCKETKNYKKLAVVAFILTSNILDEIGIKLGIRPRDKASEETQYRYMKLVNSILTKNFKLILFKDEILDSINLIEREFLKRKGEIPLDHITEIFKIYYEIRKIDVPNLHKQWESNIISEDSDINLYSFLSPAKRQKLNSSENKLKPLILHKLKTKERTIQKELNSSYDKNLFESVIYLKKAKNSLKKEENGKIILTGQLKDNIEYQRSLDNILGYSFIGVFILFFLLGIIVTLEAILFPLLTAAMSFLFLVTYCVSVLFFILYWKNFRNEES